MARRKKNRLSTIYVVSLGAHLAVGAVLALIPQKKLQEVVAIALNEPPPKDEKKPEPPKPPAHTEEPKAERAPRAPRSVVSAQPTAAAASQAPAFTDLGLTLDSNAQGGLAVNVAPAALPQPRTAPPAELVMKPKLLVARHSESLCEDPIVKPRPLGVVRPSYTDEARRARVEGRIRIELTVDDRGAVTGTKILEGLGHGLDDAALEAARRLRFSPATHCNKAVSASFIIAMRFVLGS